MWRPASTVVAIAAEPLTTDEVKRRLRIDASDEDGTISAMIKESRDYAERYCGACIATRTLALQCGAFADFAHLPEAPLQSIASITYVDPDGAPQTLSNTVYENWSADSLAAAIVLKHGQAWPAIQQGSWITLTGVFGFDVVPPALSRAMLIHIAEAEAHREDKAAEAFSAVDALLCNFCRS